MAGTIPGNLNQSVWSSCEIINYLSKREWCRLKDIANDLGMEQTRVHRLLNTLAMHDFVQYDEDTHWYRLGFQFYNIAYRMSRNSIISAAKPHLDHAAEVLLETVNLGVLANDKAKLVHIYRLDGNLSAVYDDIPIGVSRFTNESALGKAILAFLPIGEQQSVISRVEFHPYTERTIMTKEDLRNDLAAIRKRGYAIDNGEIDPACYCLAMPVFDVTDNAIAAISVSMIGKPPSDRMKYVLSVLRETAIKTEQSLGHE